MRSQRRMDRILRARRAQETAAKAALAVAEGQLRASTERVESCRERVDQALEDLRDRGSKGAFEPRRALIERIALDGLQRDVTRWKTDREVMRRAADAQRAAWTRTRAAVQGLERLRDRAVDEERRETQIRADLEMGERAAHLTQGARSSTNRSRPDDPRVPSARSGEESA